MFLSETSDFFMKEDQGISLKGEKNILKRLSFDFFFFKYMYISFIHKPDHELLSG